MEFYKMNGIGNDYIFIWNSPSITDYSALAVRLSNRNFGVGGDGLVIISQNKAGFTMRIFNADGSEAEMCGNAIRCVARILYDEGYTSGNALDIHTKCGTKHIEINSEGGSFVSATVDMGAPKLVAEYAGIEGLSSLKITAVDIGNPHAVFVCSKLDRRTMLVAEKLSTHQIFPNGTNAEAVVVTDKNNIQMRVWERGSGETLACGTGASAAMFACYIKGLVSNKVTVHLRGGELKIQYTSGHLFMSGSAEYNYRGTLEIHNG